MTVLLSPVHLLDDRGLPATATTAELEPILGLDPGALVDLMLASALRTRSTSVVLEPSGAASALRVKRGNITFGAYRVPVDVGVAAVVRIAWIAGLDPLVERGAPESWANVAKVRVRIGDDVSELLVSVGASAQGLEAELQTLSVNGLSPEWRGGALKRCPRCGMLDAAARSACASDGTPLVEVYDDPRPGGIVGMYRVLERLGEGGVGAVYAGEHALLGRPVAIKLLHRSFAHNPVLARRFLSEARASSRLHHPNIVDVTDFGLLPDGRAFMVMERLDGESLEAYLDRVGVLQPLPALLIAREISLALSAAHDGGVIHNDLKPSNVLLLLGSTADAPRLKLIDFGAASLAGVDDDDGMVIGTPAYMAPERSMGGPIDGRADFYALGVVLYEMLSGGVPFEGNQPAAVVLAHARNPVPALTSPFGVLPEVVTRIVRRALAKKASERYQGADEMMAEINRSIAALNRKDWRRWLP